MRIHAASSAHLLLVFDTPPSSSEIQGLITTMEKVSGPGSVTSFQAQDKKSPTERRSSKRILSVAVTLGRTPVGETVMLGDQIRSIQQIVRNDTSIKEVVYNPDWVARVDFLAGISGGLKKALEILLGVLCLGLGLNWASWGPVLWGHLFSVSHSTRGPDLPNQRTRLFQRDPVVGDPQENTTVEELPKPYPAAVRIFAPCLSGILSGIVAVFLGWVLRAFLYPGMDNPFDLGSLAPLPPDIKFWVTFLLSTGVVGLTGGILSLVLPLSPTKRALHHP